MPGEAAPSDRAPRSLRRTFVAGAASIAVLGGLLLTSCGDFGGSDGDVERIELGRPPIVLILLDALHAEHLSQFGNPRETSPNLDRLASEGFSFPSAFAPAPYTLATVSSILTGRLPDKHGLVDKEAVLEPDEVTLAELLSSAGYRTHAAVGNLNGSSIFGCDQGFDDYVEVFRAEDGRSVDMVYGDDKYHFARAVDYPPLVKRFLAQDDDRPPFLYLHILEPHEPYVPPESYRTRWVDPDYDGAYAQGDSATLIQGRQGKREFTDEDKTAIEALYDANLAHVDEVVGRILDQLDEHGIGDDALIIVTSDHGEAFWQHGEQGHNTTLYDEMLHVPLIVRFPKGKGPQGGARSEGLVTPMDLVPSLCDWLDLRLPSSDIDGRSLTATLQGKPDPERALPLRSHHKDPWWGLRTLERKTILVRGEEGVPSRVEHYRMDADPDETSDVRAEHAAEVDADVRRLEEYAIEAAKRRVSRGMALTASEKAMLERLGYAGEDEE